MSVLEFGVERIYSEDFETQKHFITTICNEVRKRELNILFYMKAFYVPNDYYMINYFGPSIQSVNFDCYDYLGNCKWKYHLVVPIRDVMGSIVGFTGYNPYVDIANKNKKLGLELSENDYELTKMARYKESSSVVMDKSKYFICPLGLEKAINDGYIILVDGFFDSISLANEGFNSISILGSTISEYVLFCLNLVKIVYVAHDNDSAGKKVFNLAKSKHPSVHSIVQSKCKDIDDFIKKYPNEFRDGMKQINSKFPMSFSLNA